MHSYMAHEKKITPFYTYYLVTLGATQGIFLAGNFIVLLVFFELMSLTSGSWVTYYENQEAEQAGSLYHHLGVAAGIFMGAAIILCTSQGLPSGWVRPRLTLNMEPSLPGQSCY